MDTKAFVLRAKAGWDRFEDKLPLLAPLLFRFFLFKIIFKDTNNETTTSEVIRK